MAVTADDFLRVAKSSLDIGTEIAFRNAASRAYYAAFHSCLPLPGKSAYRGGTHEVLYKDLLAIPKYKAVAYMLRQCHGFRVTADYALGQEFSEADAETVIFQVEGIVSRLAQSDESSANAG